MSALRVFVSRALDLLLRSRRDRRLDAEVDLHLSLLTDEGVARGMTPEAAHVEARRRFGGVDRVKTRYRDQRGLPAVDALRQDARFATRVLVRDRGFALTAVLVLGLGIGVNNMMFTIVNAHTIRGLPLRGVDRVLYVSTRDATGADRGVSWPELENLRRAVASTDLGAFVTGTASMANEHEAPDRVDRTHVDVGTFAVLGIEPILGRAFTAADGEPGAPPVALLSERIWRARYHADAGTLGRTVLVDGAPVTVIGIMDRESGFPAVADVWQPLEHMTGLPRSNRNARTLRVVGRVRPAADVAAARAEIETLFAADAAEHAETGAAVRAQVVPINERVLGRLVDQAWLAFMAVGCLVALISCANVANLLLGRALHRDREIALRTSLGATRARIVRQLLIESMLLASAGAALGLAIGVAGVRFFRQGIPANVLPYWMDYTIDWRVLLALALTSAVATLVFGLVPALQASRSDPQAVLRQGGPTVANRVIAHRWTTGFLVVQIALGVVMLANLALAWRVSRSGLPTDAALYTDDVLTATLTLPADRYGDAPGRRAFLRRVEEAVEGAPGILTVAAATVLPVRPAPERQLRALTAVNREPTPVRLVMVTPSYFDTLRLGLREGHDLGDPGAGGAGAMLVNEHLAAALFPDRSPLGERIGFVASAADNPTDWHTIVGVAPTIRQRPSLEPEAVVYQPLDATPPATLSLLVRIEASPEAASARLREAVLGIDPHLPLYNIATLRQATADAEWNARVSNRLIFALAAIAIGLAAVGLYAVTSRSVAGRRREIGIRLAVGAAPGQIRRLVLGQALRRVAAGMVVGVIAVMAWQAAFAPSARAGAAGHRFTLIDPYALLSIGGVLVIITLVACLAPVRRAQAVSPSIALGRD